MIEIRFVFSIIYFLGLALLAYEPPILKETTILGMGLVLYVICFGIYLALDKSCRPKPPTDKGAGDEEPSG